MSLVDRSSRVARWSAILVCALAALRGKLTRLNRALIPSVSGGTPDGHAYSWLDRNARRGVQYAYRLEAVLVNGTRTWLGSVVARR